MKDLKTTVPLLLFAAIFLGLDAIAQPVILNGNNLPAVGRKDTSANSAASTVSYGPAGANVNWNLSAVVATKNTIYEWVTTASTPYTSTFPLANKAIKGNNIGSASPFYHYRRLSATNWEHIAQGVVNATTALDYSTGPKTIFPIPFHYQDVFVDTFTLTGSATATQTITYDGYGSLTTPYGSFSNVMRYKADNGSSFSYTWMEVSPVLREIATYYSSTQQYYFMGTTPVTGIEEPDPAYNAVKVYPNPVTNNSTIRISSNIKEGRFILSDLSGRIVKELDIRNNEGILNRDGISNGLYTYVVLNNSSIIAKGRLALQ